MYICGMDVSAYIDSGILENYCMGFCTESEKKEVEQNAVKFPEIKAELEEIRAVMEEYICAQQIQPSDNLKYSLMQKVYAQHAIKDTSYLPILSKDESAVEIEKWLEHHPVEISLSPNEEMTMMELPSTPTITNFLVCAKSGHEPEMHTDFDEFFYVVRGTCTMYFDEKPKNYHEGQVVYIPPHITHYAVVTSDLPMIAIVQRQACA